MNQALCMVRAVRFSSETFAWWFTLCRGMQMLLPGESEIIDAAENDLDLEVITSFPEISENTMTEARTWVTTVTFTWSWVPVWHGYMPTINNFPGTHNSKKLGSCFQAGFFFLFLFVSVGCVSADFTWRLPVCLHLFYRLMVPVTAQLKGKTTARVMKPHAPWHRRVTHGGRDEFLPFTTGRALFCYQSSVQGEECDHTHLEMHTTPQSPSALQGKGQNSPGLITPQEGSGVPGVSWAQPQQRQMKLFWWSDFHLGCWGLLYLLEKPWSEGLAGSDSLPQE